MASKIINLPPIISVASLIVSIASFRIYFPILKEQEFDLPSCAIRKQAISSRFLLIPSNFLTVLFEIPLVDRTLRESVK